MFTGIIQKKSKVLGTADKLSIKKVLIEKGSGDQIKLGQSVSINGVCSTVMEVGDMNFAVEYMSETLKKTTMNNMLAGQFANVEQSVKAGDPIDGHFVYGHIDCLGMIDKVKKEGESAVFSVSIPKEFHKYVAYKGSVTVDGVSLTISNITKTGFEVALIPYTLINTTLGERKTGDIVNIETDIIARYLERLGQSSKVKDQN